MKSSNLAWRIEPPDEQPLSPPPLLAPSDPRLETVARVRPRARFERRTIEIRDQGFAPFRVR